MKTCRQLTGSENQFPTKSQTARRDFKARKAIPFEKSVGVQRSVKKTIIILYRARSSRARVSARGEDNDGLDSGVVGDWARMTGKLSPAKRNLSKHGQRNWKTEDTDPGGGSGTPDANSANDCRLLQQRSTKHHHFSADP